MLGRKLKNEINLISIKNILKEGGRLMPATLDDIKKYEEAAHALCFGVFSILRNIEYIEKDFPLLDDEQQKKFTREYVYYRIFLVDYKTYCYLGQTEEKSFRLAAFYDEVERIFNREDTKALMSFDTAEMRQKIDLYANLYRNAGFDDSKAEGYSCAKILTLAGLETDRDYDAKQYFNFRMGYFLRDNIAFYKLIQNVLSAPNNAKAGQGAAAATSSSGCLLPIIASFAVVLLMSFL